MNNNKPSFGKLTWRLTIMLIAGMVPAQALVLFTIFKHRGYLTRLDWVAPIIVFLTISVVLLGIAYRANHN